MGEAESSCEKGLEPTTTHTMIGTPCNRPGLAASAPFLFFPIFLSQTSDKNVSGWQVLWWRGGRVEQCIRVCLLAAGLLVDEYFDSYSVPRVQGS